MSSRVLEKEDEKVERYTDMTIEIKTLWKMKSVKITPVVIGALGTVSNNLDKHLKQISSTITMEMIQKSVLFKTPRILRPVLGI